MFKKVLNSLVVVFFMLPLAVSAATLDDLEARITNLERQLEQAKQDQKALAKVVESAPIQAKDDNVNVSLYGRLWPRLTYRDGDNSSTDITDALSRVGISADAKVSDSVTAFLKGEWDVDVEANGNFGDARQAYVGLKSDTYGLIAIGKQWDPHFNITAEVTDIYYHRSSPFGYDYAGPFRTNNLVRYANSYGGLKVDIGVQVNGDAEGSNGGANDADGATPNHFDAASAGVGYNFPFYSSYLGVSYLHQSAATSGTNYERNFFGIGGSTKPIERLYFAFTYQYITEERAVNRSPDPSNPIFMNEKLDQYTLDVLASYDLGSDYTGIAGFFGYDDGFANGEILGYTITLIKRLNSSTKVFGEWLRRDPDTGATADTFSIGIRYDFDAPIL